MGGSGSKNQSNNMQETVIPCKYHGWVGLTHSQLERGIARSGQNMYDCLVNWAKNAGIRQSKENKGERALLEMIPEQVQVRSCDPKKEQGTPLLHARINTVICSLISRRTGIAVIVAHTWNGRGEKMIGFDVITFKKNTKTKVGQFRDAMNDMIGSFTHRTLREQQAQITALQAQLNGESGDEPVPPRYSSPELPHARTRTESEPDSGSDIDNDGYMTITGSGCPVDIDQDYIEPLYDFCRHTQDTVDTGYMEIEPSPNVLDF